jgi:hypothetical protein
MAHHPVMKDFLQLNEQDIVMSLLYLGYSDEQIDGKRQTEIEQKVIWK